MKILSISNVCLVGALMLGLFVAWSASCPQQLSERSLIVGGCNPSHGDKCKGTSGSNCSPSYPGANCKATHLTCWDSGGGKYCYKLRNYVCLPTRCKNVKDETCV